MQYRIVKITQMDKLNVEDNVAWIAPHLWLKHI